MEYDRFSAQSQSTLIYVFRLGRLCTGPIYIFQLANKCRIVSSSFLKVSYSTRQAFIFCLSRAGPTDAIIAGVRSTNFELSAPFSDKLYSRYIINIQPYQLGVNLDVGNMFRPQKKTESQYQFLSGTEFPVLLTLHINLSH